MAVHHEGHHGIGIPADIEVDHLFIELLGPSSRNADGVDAIGTRGIDGGPIANSVAAEALTSILIGINRRYKVDGAGLRITGDIRTSEKT